MSVERNLKINPREHDCFGYEYSRFNGNTTASLEKIALLLFGIENNDDIPATNMFEFEAQKNYYELICPFFLEDPCQDGGHHRLLAHIFGQYMMDVVLHSPETCIIGREIPENLRTHTSEMNVTSQPEILTDLSRVFYKIPKGLENPSKFPSDHDVRNFFDERRNQQITSAEIIETLYH